MITVTYTMKCGHTRTQEVNPNSAFARGMVNEAHCDRCGGLHLLTAGPTEVKPDA